MPRTPTQRFISNGLRRYRNDDMTMHDQTLVHQFEYAWAHFTPDQLRRQAQELLASTLA